MGTELKAAEKKQPHAHETFILQLIPKNKNFLFHEINQTHTNVDAITVMTNANNVGRNAAIQ